MSDTKQTPESCLSAVTCEPKTEDDNPYTNDQQLLSLQKAVYKYKNKNKVILMLYFSRYSSCNGLILRLKKDFGETMVSKKKNVPIGRINNPVMAVFKTHENAQRITIKAKSPESLEGIFSSINYAGIKPLKDYKRVSLYDFGSRRRAYTVDFNNRWRGGRELGDWDGEARYSSDQDSGNTDYEE